MDPAFVVVGVLIALILFAAWDTQRSRRSTELSLWDSIARTGKFRERIGPVKHTSFQNEGRESQPRDKDLAP